MSTRSLAVLGLCAFVVGAVVAADPEPAPVATAPAASAHATTPPRAATAPATATPRPPIPPGYRIQIPRLGIDLAILEGDVERDAVLERTPDGAAFHLPGTGLPGGGVNTYIYAHARRGMFLALWDARVGDEIWITSPDGRALRYEVREIHPRVDPKDTSWAQASPPERLTLQTSTGPSSADPRFIVVAHP